MKNSKLKVCLFSVLALSVQSAFAWQHVKCNSSGGIKWQSNKLEFYYSDYNFKPGSAWLSSIRTAISRVNENPSKLRASLKGKTRKASLKNKSNDIWFSNAITAPAEAMIAFDCDRGKILRADIRINAKKKNYTNSLRKSNLISYGGSNSSFQTALLHEMGHAAGLGHTSDNYSVMGSNWTFFNVHGNYVRPYLGADAAKGLMKIYGKASKTIEDLSVSHWRFDKPDKDNKYSVHRRTKVLNSSKKSAKSIRVKGEPVYLVDSGKTAYVEFTYENNGKNSKTFDVDYRLSTNTTITDKDQNIGGRINMYLPAGTVFTRRYPVSIPSGLAKGKIYYIGVHIDSKKEVKEVAESNNRTYVGIKIK